MWTSRRQRKRNRLTKALDVLCRGVDVHVPTTLTLPSPLVVGEKYIVYVDGVAAAGEFWSSVNTVQFATPTQFDKFDLPPSEQEKAYLDALADQGTWENPVHSSWLPGPILSKQQWDEFKAEVTKAMKSSKPSKKTGLIMLNPAQKIVGDE